MNGTTGTSGLADPAIGWMMVTLSLGCVVFVVAVFTVAAVRSWRHRNDWQRRVFREARRRGEWPS